MNAAQKLKQIGCGDEMILCQIERGQIMAMINNTWQDLKHLKYASKEGIYNIEVIRNKKNNLLANLKTIKPLVEKFNTIYGETYSKLIASLTN